MPSPETIFFALTGGILPALLWLWFWLHEDRLHPEPRGKIIKTFLAGMGAVILTLPIQHKIRSFFPEVSLFESFVWKATPGTFKMLFVFFIWAATEEIFKWLGARWSALKSKDYDEPIDAVIYMITAALGFSALENSLFLIATSPEFNLLSFVATGNLRFIGATLLHVLSSGVLGLFIGLSFWKKARIKIIWLLTGLSIAFMLHTLFNIYIISSKGGEIFIIFGFVWLAITLLIVALGKLKQLKSLKLKKINN